METIYQVITVGNMGQTLQSWHTSEKEAEEELKNCEALWPEDIFYIHEGTDFIHEKCRGCETVHASEMHDAYGITTGYWCDDCYNSSKYPYKKHRYDYASNGERLEDDY